MADATPKLRGGQLSWGASGLILVSLRLLEFAQFRSQAIGDAYWFASSLGIVTSFAGLVVSIAAVVKKSGSRMGWAGIGAYLVLAVLFFLLHRSPSFVGVFGSRGGSKSDDKAVVEGTGQPDAAKVPDPTTEIYIQQLASSRCYQGSSGRMSCATCHESGRIVRPAEATTYYRERCLGCHREESCAIPLAERKQGAHGDDCRSCHMPAVGKAGAQKRADHRILRKP